MTDRGLSGYQTSYQHLCAMLRELLTEAVQAGQRAAGGLGSVPGRAVATLYLILLQHPVDRYGRCRPGAILGGRWRRCRVHGEARFWLHQPVDFLRAQLAHELDLHVGEPLATDPTSSQPSQPNTVSATDPDTETLPIQPLSPGHSPMIIAGVAPYLI